MATGGWVLTTPSADLDVEAPTPTTRVRLVHSSGQRAGFALASPVSCVGAISRRPCPESVPKPASTRVRSAISVKRAPPPACNDASASGGQRDTVKATRRVLKRRRLSFDRPAPAAALTSLMAPWVPHGSVQQLSASRATVAGTAVTSGAKPGKRASARAARDARARAALPGRGATPAHHGVGRVRNAAQLRVHPLADVLRVSLAPAAAARARRAPPAARAARAEAGGEGRGASEWECCLDCEAGESCVPLSSSVPHVHRRLSKEVLALAGLTADEARHLCTRFAKNRGGTTAHAPGLCAWDLALLVVCVLRGGARKLPYLAKVFGASDCPSAAAAFEYGLQRLWPLMLNEIHYPWVVDSERLASSCPSLPGCVGVVDTAVLTVRVPHEVAVAQQFTWEGSAADIAGTRRRIVCAVDTEGLVRSVEVCESNSKPPVALKGFYVSCVYDRVASLWYTREAQRRLGRPDKPAGACLPKAFYVLADGEFVSRDGENEIPFLLCPDRRGALGPDGPPAFDSLFRTRANRRQWGLGRLFHDFGVFSTGVFPFPTGCLNMALESACGLSNWLQRRRRHDAAVAGAPATSEEATAAPPCEVPAIHAGSESFRAMKGDLWFPRAANACDAPPDPANPRNVSIGHGVVREVLCTCAHARRGPATADASNAGTAEPSAAATAGSQDRVASRQASDGAGEGSGSAPSCGGAASATGDEGGSGESSVVAHAPMSREASRSSVASGTSTEGRSPAAVWQTVSDIVTRGVARARAQRAQMLPPAAPPPAAASAEPHGH